MDLEQLITETYSAYKAEVAAEENRKKLKEELETNQAIATLKRHLDKALAPEVQAVLGVELFAEAGKALAQFKYKSNKFWLEYGHFRDGYEWIVWMNDVSSGYSTRENLHSYILVELGKIRELAQPVPVMLSPLAQILNVAHCLEESLDSQEIEEIKATAKQLIEMIRLHGQGELKPVVAATFQQPF